MTERPVAEHDITSDDVELTRVRPPDDGRDAWVRRGLRLNAVTTGYNVLEALVAVAAGIGAGSVALTGFGVDSGIEVASSLAARWRLRVDRAPGDRAGADRRTHRFVGATLIALGGYVAYESAVTLWRQEHPDGTLVGVGLLLLSCLIMPILARAKRRVAHRLGSPALAADAMQTSLCAYLSVIALAGVGLNAFAGWWWADPVAGLCLVPIILKEGLEGLRATGHCGCDT